MQTQNPMHQYDAAPSGLTREERFELVALMNKPRWTNSERSRIQALRAKMNIVGRG